jgi:hypothetical protein
MAGSTRSFGAGAEDFWLVKTDEFGNVEWNRTYGGPNIDIAHSMVATSDGGYALAGYTASFGSGSLDFWLVKTDGSGNVEWNQTYGETGSEWARAVIKTADGGYAIAGETNSLGVGHTDWWLVKTDASGSMQWSKTYGGTENDAVSSLAATPDGGYALAGYTDSFGAGTNDFWLVKTDSSGDAEWSQTYGGTEWDLAYSMVVTSDGGYVLAGYTDSFDAGTGRDFWLVRADASGKMLWNKTYGGTEADVAQSLVATSDGGYALAGSTMSFGAGQKDFWLVVTDGSGNVVWSQTYGGTESEWARAVIETFDGCYALVGGTKPSGFGYEDFLLVKTTANQLIPEYSSLLLPLLLLTATLVIIINEKKLLKSRSKET